MNEAGRLQARDLRSAEETRRAGRAGGPVLAEGAALAPEAMESSVAEMTAREAVRAVALAVRQWACPVGAPRAYRGAAGVKRSAKCPRVGLVACRAVRADRGLAPAPHPRPAPAPQAGQANLPAKPP